MRHFILFLLVFFFVGNASVCQAQDEQNKNKRSKREKLSDTYKDDRKNVKKEKRSKRRKLSDTNKDDRKKVKKKKRSKRRKLSDTNKDDRKNNKKSKKGKLGKLPDTHNDNRIINDSDDGWWIELFLDPEMIVHAVSDTRPGPYPYNGVAANFSPADPYPGGILQFQSSYFRHDANLFGLLWRINYYYQRFGVDVDLINLIEDLGKENDYMNLSGWRVSWDFIGQADFRFGGQLGLRNLSYGGVSNTGPEIGFRLVGLPEKPFIFESAGTIARINGNQFSTLSGTLGLMIKRVHLFIGGQIIRSSDISIDGLKIGFRLWL